MRLEEIRTYKQIYKIVNNVRGERNGNETIARNLFLLSGNLRHFEEMIYGNFQKGIQTENGDLRMICEKILDEFYEPIENLFLQPA